MPELNFQGTIRHWNLLFLRSLAVRRDFVVMRVTTWLLLLLPAALCFHPLGVTTHGSPRTAPIVMEQVKLTAGGKQCMVGEGSSMLAACKKLGIKVRS